MRTGGLVIDAMRSYAYQSAAADQLQALIPELDEDACHAIADAIGDRPEKMEPVHELVQRDREFVLTGQPFLQELSLRVHAATVSQLTKPTVASTTAAQRRVQRQMSVLAARTAIRRFQLAEGRLPDRLAELTPRFLSPQLAASSEGERLFYQRTDDDYVIYTESEEDNAPASNKTTAPQE